MNTKKTLTRLVLLSLIPGTGCNVILHIGRAEGTEPGGGGTGEGAAGYDAAASTDAATSSGADAPIHPIPAAHAPMTSASKLDLLFMIDNSASMAALQTKMRAKIRDFTAVLDSLPGGPPDLHVAVVSSSLGAGLFGNVPGCMPGTDGNANGAFQHPAACTGLHAGQSFIISSNSAGGQKASNFDGDMADLLSCMADLGDRGCGFEHQFESVRLALQRSQTAGSDPNAGFLRDDAYLAIIMLTNEDDCSVPPNSDLFDPSQQSVADRYGGLQSYRCNEFGHRCDQLLPHGVDGLPMMMTGCTSKEDGTLVTVNGFVDFLFSLKPMQPENIFVAAITGPVTPYTIESRLATLENGAMEMQPSVHHSCASTMDETQFADPAVRLKQWADAFGPNSFLGSICADDFGPTMRSIALRMVAP